MTKVAAIKKGDILARNLSRADSAELKQVLVYNSSIYSSNFV